MDNDRETNQFGASIAEPGDAGGQWFADDRFYRALAAAPRRRLLAYLLEHESATRYDLAAMLAGWETTATGEMVGTEKYHRLNVALRHTHLPMLDDVGLVDHDTDTGEVVLELTDERAIELVKMSVRAEGD